MHSCISLGLSNAVLATGLALVAAFATRFVRRPEVASLLWLLVLIKLLSPSLVNIPWNHSRPTLVWDRLASSSPRQVFLDRQALYSEVRLPVAGRDAHDVAAESLRRQLARLMHDNAKIIFLTWVAGSTVWFGLATFRIVGFVRILRRALLAPDEIQEEVRQLASRMKLGRIPEVRLANCRIAPLVWALVGRPTLLLPLELWQNLTAPQRTTLLAHELAHLKRRDDLVRWLELAALGVYWWHPVAWWARHMRSQAEELCCDARVIRLAPEKALAYAQALLAAIDFVSEVPTPRPVAASAISQTGLMRQRLERILFAAERERANGPSRFGLLTIGLAVLPLSLPGLPPMFPRSQQVVVVLRKGLRLTPAGMLPGDPPRMERRQWTRVGPEPSRLVEMARHKEFERPEIADSASTGEPERGLP